MAIVRFRPLGSALDPFRDISDMQSEMNRVFDSFFGRPSQVGGVERIWAPAVDMYETKDELMITAELPGLNEKDIHLSITGDVLTLKGAALEPGGEAGKLLPRGAVVREVRAGSPTPHS